MNMSNSYRWFQSIYTMINKCPELYQIEIDSILQSYNEKKNKKNQYNVSKFAYIIKDLTNNSLDKHGIDIPIKNNFDTLYDEINKSITTLGDDIYQQKIRNKKNPLYGTYIRMYACADSDNKKYIIIEVLFLPKQGNCMLV